MNEEVKIPDNVDIDQALKEFESKSSVEQAPKAPEISTASNLPKMVQWVMKYSGGIIKEERQANYVLFGIAILIFAVSFYLFFS
ncbi:hypothetical protein HYW72_02040 [Candidatus Nomurabacteria bacterium]|nr:hypothetical protein [Candidatus Nomurabacteria bacterium]